MKVGLRGAAILACSFAIACDVYHPEPLDAARDAASDARDSTPDARAACGRRPPRRPNGANGDGPEIVFALRNVVLDQRGSRWQEVALDLDDTCTTDETLQTCVSGGGTKLDGPEGVDNSFGSELLANFVQVNPRIQMEAEIDQNAGRAASVLVLNGWDGSANDSRVQAHLAQSVYAVPAGGARGDLLAWDGTDTWYVSETDYVDGRREQPFIIDEFAYVADYVLVMKIPDGRSVYFPWSGNRLQVTLQDGLIVGRISPELQTISEVKLTGRWTLPDTQIALTGAGICPGTTERFAAERLITNAADVRSDPATDNMGGPCDAVSVALGLDGVRARFGQVVPVESLPPPCN